MLKVAGGVAIAFGVLTVVAGGATLFGQIEMGAVVPLVLWFNTIAGLAYVVAGWGLWQARRWALPLSTVIFAATVLISLRFGFHVAQGGAFEMRTVFALALRAVVWGAITLAARNVLSDR